MRTQLSRKTSDKALEIQSIQAGDSVLLHMNDGIKITVEQENGGDLSISVAFGHSTTGVQVYDGEGEYLGTIRPASFGQEEDDG